MTLLFYRAQYGAPGDFDEWAQIIGDQSWAYKDFSRSVDNLAYQSLTKKLITELVTQLFSKVRAFSSSSRLSSCGRLCTWL